MGGFKIEKNNRTNFVLSRTNLRFVQNKSPEICSVDVERTKNLFWKNLMEQLKVHRSCIDSHLGCGEKLCLLARCRITTCTHWQDFYRFSTYSVLLVYLSLILRGVAVNIVSGHSSSGISNLCIFTIQYCTRVTQCSVFSYFTTHLSILIH